MSRNKLFINFPSSVVQGAFFEKGLFNNSVFIEYFNETILKNFVKVTVGAADSWTGKFIRFTKSLGFEDFAFKAVRGSASIPGVFPAVKFQNMTLVDWGVINYLDVSGAIKWCK